MTRVGGFLVVVILVGALAGCSGNKPANTPAPSNSAGSNASQKDDIYTLRLMYGTDFYSLPAVVGVEKGFFTKEGLSVNIQRLPYGNLGLQALVAKSADLSITANTRFINAVLQEFPVKAIALSAFGYTGKLLVPAKETTAKTLADFKGKRLGLQAGTGIHAVFLNYVAKSGLSLNDFQIKNVKNVDLPAALARGDLDVALVWEPLATAAVTSGLARVLVSDSDIGKVAQSDFAFPVVTSNQLIKEKPEALERFARAWVKTLTWITDNPQEAAKIEYNDLYLSGLEVDQASLDEAMKNVRWDRALIKQTDVDDMMRTGEAYVKLGELKALPKDLWPYIDNGFVEKALKAGAK